MSDIVETKGTQSNQIKRNPYDANYKLIVIKNVEKHVIAKQMCIRDRILHTTF